MSTKKEFEKSFERALRAAGKGGKSLGRKYALWGLRLGEFGSAQYLAPTWIGSVVGVEAVKQIARLSFERSGFDYVKAATAGSYDGPGYVYDRSIRLATLPTERYQDPSTGVVAPQLSAGLKQQIAEGRRPRETKHLVVTLAAVHNPDFRERPSDFASVPHKRVAVESLREASRVVRQYIEQYGLGGGNFVGGDVHEHTPAGSYSSDTLVARVSYNGRVWAPNGEEIAI